MTASYRPKRLTEPVPECPVDGWLLSARRAALILVHARRGINHRCGPTLLRCASKESFASLVKRSRSNPAPLIAMALSLKCTKDVSRILAESSVAKRRGGKAWGFNPRNWCIIRISSPGRGGGDAGWFSPAPLRGYQRLRGIDLLGLKPQALRLRRYAAEGYENPQCQAYCHCARRGGASDGGLRWRRVPLPKPRPARRGGAPDGGLNDNPRLAPLEICATFRAHASPRARRRTASMVYSLNVPT